MFIFIPGMIYRLCLIYRLWLDAVSVGFYSENKSACTHTDVSRVVAFIGLDIKSSCCSVATNLSDQWLFSNQLLDYNMVEY